MHPRVRYSDYPRFSFYSLISIAARCSNHHYPMARQWVWRTRRHKQRQSSNVSSSCICACPPQAAFISNHSTIQQCWKFSSKLEPANLVDSELRYENGEAKWGFQVDDFGPRYIVRAQRKLLPKLTKADINGSSLISIQTNPEWYQT